MYINNDFIRNMQKLVLYQISSVSVLLLQSLIQTKNKATLPELNHERK